MKCFKRTLAYDLKHGIWEKKGGYFVTALLAVFLFTDYSIKLRNYYGNGMAGNPDVTMADYLLYFFSGRYPYMEGEQVFLIPITWLLIFLCSSLLVLNYPMQNLCGHGIQVLIRIRDRKLWWLSKCGYVLCSTVLYYFILYAVTFVLCLISGVRLSASYSESAMENILNFTFQTPPEKNRSPGSAAFHACTCFPGGQSAAAWPVIAAGPDLCFHAGRCIAAFIYLYSGMLAAGSLCNGNAEQLGDGRRCLMETGNIGGRHIHDRISNGRDGSYQTL